MFLRLFILTFSSINVGEGIAERASTVVEVKMSYCFQKREDFLLSLGGLPQLSRHAMLRDGERCLGSHEVVAGVVAVSAQLTQDAGRAHTDRDKQKQKYGCSAKLKNIQDMASVLNHNVFYVYLHL